MRKRKAVTRPFDLAGGQVLPTVERFEHDFASQGRQGDDALYERGDRSARVCFLLPRGSEERVERRVVWAMPNGAPFPFAELFRELLPWRLYEDSPKVKVNDPHILVRSCENGGALKGPFSSRKADDVLNSVGREPALSVFPTVLQDEGNRFSEIFLAFLKGLTLTICAGDLWAIPDVPYRVTLDDRGEFVMKRVLRHESILPHAWAADQWQLCLEQASPSTASSFSGRDANTAASATRSP
jgi:hypothetical protein